MGFDKKYEGLIQNYISSITKFKFNLNIEFGLMRLQKKRLDQN
jgi:hypothetical protein